MTTEQRRRVLRYCLLAAAMLAQGCAASRHGGERWVATWTASPQSPEPPMIAPKPAQLADQTVREIAHVSIGGTRLRIRLSNEFGTQAVVIGAASIARQSSGAGIVPATLRTLTFGGSPSVTLQPGAPALSDPVDLLVPPLSNLSISLYFPTATAVTTFHSLGVQNTYIAAAGDAVSVAQMPEATTTTSWLFLSAINVEARGGTRLIVALGDSITDGYGSTIDANRRWPNLLAARLQAQAGLHEVAIVDQGISGNRVLFDFIGPNALARLDRDVLAVPGVRYVILLEGINNFGFPGLPGHAGEQVTAAEVIGAYRQIIERCRERGLRIYGATLTPFEGTTFPGYYSIGGEVQRQAVNAWIRTSGGFDAVIDFDAALRDPTHPARLLPAYDAGDHLHPNDAGYQAMADQIDLGLFTAPR